MTISYHHKLYFVVFMVCFNILVILKWISIIRYKQWICKPQRRHGPLTRYENLRIAHAPGMPGTFSPAPRVSDPDMHHGTCVTHVPWCIPGSLTSGFLCCPCGENVFSIPGACTTLNFMYLVRGSLYKWSGDNCYDCKSKLIPSSSPRDFITLYFCRSPSRSSSVIQSVLKIFVSQQNYIPYHKIYHSKIVFGYPPRGQDQRLQD